MTEPGAVELQPRPLAFVTLQSRLAEMPQTRTDVIWPLIAATRTGAVI